MDSVFLHIPQNERPWSPEDTLAFYDGPLLFWLTREAGFRRLALALPDDEGIGPYPFLVADVPEFDCVLLEENGLRLRSAFERAAACYVMPDYDADVLTLKPIVGDVNPDWLPGDITLTVPLIAKD